MLEVHQERIKVTDLPRPPDDAEARTAATPGRHAAPSEAGFGFRAALRLERETRLALGGMLGCVILIVLAAVPSLPRADGLGSANTHDEGLSRQVRALFSAPQYRTVAVGVVDGGRIHTAGFRAIRAAHEPEVTADTLYGIGWLTSSLTGMLLAALAKQGTVRLDERIGDILGGAGFADPGLRSATLEELASNRAGLPWIPGRRYGRDTEDPLTLALGTTPRGPRLRYTPSRIGYVLLAKAIEKRTGRSIAELLRQYVLIPANMGSTFLHVSSDDVPRQAARPHIRGRVVDPWVPSGYEASAGAYSTGCDLSRLLVRILDSSAPGVDAAAPRFPVGGSLRAGLGWISMTTAGRDITMQTSADPGYRMFIGFDRAAQRGVVVLSNSDASITAQATRLLVDRRVGAARSSNTRCR